MAKKDNTLYYLIGAVLLGGASFLFYRQWKKKKDTPQPITPLPPSTGPAPVPTPSGPAPASATKISELQNLMIKRYIQLNRDDEYNAAAAKGGWGNKSTSALQYLQPTNFASRGIPNANNIDAWIASIKKDVETASKEIQQQQQQQKSESESKILAGKYAEHFKKGGTLEVLTDFNAVLHKYDAIKNSYIPTKDTKKFFRKNKIKKGSTYTSVINRQNGQIIIVVNGVNYYPTSPSNLIAL